MKRGCAEPDRVISQPARAVKKLDIPMQTDLVCGRPNRSASVPMEIAAIMIPNRTGLAMIPAWAKRAPTVRPCTRRRQMCPLPLDSGEVTIRGDSDPGFGLGLAAAAPRASGRSLEHRPARGCTAGPGLR